VVLLNTAGFFQPLLAVFEHLFTLRFARREHADLYHVAATPMDAWAYLAAYEPRHPPTKWMSA